MIVLKTITNSDIRFLFDSLKERNSNVSISHKKMPSYEQHVKFVKSKPYSKWYVILKGKEKIGSIYLSKNDEIGISILEDYKKKNIEKYVLKLLMKKNPRKRFLANVSPNNKKLISFFKDNGFKLIQYTYEFES
jgi:hypothetical protein